MRLGFQTQKEEKLGHRICWCTALNPVVLTIFIKCLLHHRRLLTSSGQRMSTPGWPLPTEQTSATDANEGSHTGTKTCLSPSSRPSVPSWATRPEACRLRRLKLHKETGWHFFSWHNMHNAKNHPLAGGLHAFSLIDPHPHTSHPTALRSQIHSPHGRLSLFHTDLPPRFMSCKQNICLVICLFKRQKIRKPSVPHPPPPAPPNVCSDQTTNRLLTNERATWGPLMLQTLTSLPFVD